MLNRKSAGKSFCQVVRIRHEGQLRPDITFGNQKCRGAAPSFIMRPRNTETSGRWGEGWGIDSQIPPPRRRKEPRIWARKYLVVASYSLLVEW